MLFRSQGGNGYFPGAANNFKFSLGVMPGRRGFSSTETHGWLPLDFQLSAGALRLGDALALLVEQESQAQNQSWLAGGAFSQHVIHAEWGISGKLDNSAHGFELIPSNFDWGK